MRKVPKQEKMMRINLLVLVVALVGVVMVTNGKQKETIAKLEFLQTTAQSSFELKRAAYNGSEVGFVHAGEVEFGSDNVFFTLEEKPIYPWEENRNDEVADRMWLEYNNITKIMEQEGQTPIGVLEAYGEYYLAAENDSERVFYTLTDLIPVDKLGNDEMLMVLKSYVEEETTNK